MIPSNNPPPPAKKDSQTGMRNATAAIGGNERRSSESFVGVIDLDALSALGSGSAGSALLPESMQSSAPAATVLQQQQQQQKTMSNAALLWNNLGSMSGCGGGIAGQLSRLPLADGTQGSVAPAASAPVLATSNGNIGISQVAAARQSSKGPKSSPPASAGKTKSSPKKAKRWTWKKPAGKPKRPLSAYNLFFAEERRRIVSSQQDDTSTFSSDQASSTSSASSPHLPSLSTPPPTTTSSASQSTQEPPQKKLKRRPHRRSHGKISFSDLARTIAARWKSLDTQKRAPFADRAAKDKARYQREMKIWKLAEEIRKDKERQRKLEEIISKAKGGGPDSAAAVAQAPTTRSSTCANEQGSEEASQLSQQESVHQVEQQVEEQVTPKPATPEAQQPQRPTSVEPTTTNNLFTTPLAKIKTSGIGNISAPAAPMSLTGETNPLDAHNLGPTLSRNNSFSHLPQFDDDIGFGDDELVSMPSSLMSGVGGHGAGGAASLADAAMSQAAAHQALQEHDEQQEPSSLQSQEASDEPLPSSANTYLDMLLEGTADERDLVHMDTTDKDHKKNGAANIGDISLPSQQVPLLPPMPSDQYASSDTCMQLLQDVITSIGSLETNRASVAGITAGNNGADMSAALPHAHASSLDGTSDLVGNFLRGSAA